MKKSKKVSIDLSQEYYPKEAVIITCCQFLRDNYVFLEKRKDIRVMLTPKKAGGLQKIEREFRNELINNTLRYYISQKNKGIREYIVKTALFCSQPEEAADDLLLKELEGAQAAGWQEDPLGIAIPWEEKNRKNKDKKKK